MTFGPGYVLVSSPHSSAPSHVCVHVCARERMCLHACGDGDSKDISACYVPTFQTWLFRKGGKDYITPSSNHGT